MRRDVGYNLLGSTIPSAISIVSLPIIFNNMGAQFYGSLYLILAYVSLQNLYSLSISTIANIEKSHDKDIKPSVFYGIAFIAGIISTTVVMILIYFLYEQLSDMIDFHNQTDKLICSLIIILYIPVTVLHATLKGILHGERNFYNLNRLIILMSTSNQLVVCFLSFHYDSMISVYLLIFLLTHIVEVVLYSRLVTGPKIQSSTLLTSLKIIINHRWIMLNSIVSNLFPVADRTIIAATLDPKTLGIYTLAVQLISKVHTIIQSYNTVFLNRVSEFQGDVEKIVFSTSQFIKILIVGAACYFPVASIFILYLTFTTEAFTTQNIWIIYLLTGSHIANTYSRFLLNVNFTLSKAKHVTAYTFCESFLFMFFAFKVAQTYGLLGLVLILGIREIVLFVFLSKVIFSLSSIFVFTLLVWQVVFFGIF